VGAAGGLQGGRQGRGEAAPGMARGGGGGGGGAGGAGRLAPTVFYTGPIDRYFGASGLARLEYR